MPPTGRRRPGSARSWPVPCSPRSMHARRSAGPLPPKALAGLAGGASPPSVRRRRCGRAIRGRPIRLAAGVLAGDRRHHRRAAGRQPAAGGGCRGPHWWRSARSATASTSSTGPSSRARRVTGPPAIGAVCSWSDRRDDRAGGAVVPAAGAPDRIARPRPRIVGARAPSACAVVALVIVAVPAARQPYWMVDAFRRGAPATSDADVPDSASSTTTEQARRPDRRRRRPWHRRRRPGRAGHDRHRPPGPPAPAPVAPPMRPCPSDPSVWSSPRLNGDGHGHRSHQLGQAEPVLHQGDLGRLDRVWLHP